MKEKSKIKGQVTRRQFIGTTAAAAACTMMAPYVMGQRRSRPNSNFNGVQIGINVYSFRALPMTADDILDYMVKLGINSVEHRNPPIEEFAGAPSVQFTRPPRGTKLTEEQRAEMQAARKAQAEELRKWRLSPPWEKFRELRRKYNDEGIDIYIVKFPELGTMTDGELDYAFNVAKTLGAKGITTELSEETAKRVGPFADKHNIMVGLHNHTNVTPQSFDVPLSYAKYNSLNFDIGHWVAGTNLSPLPIIQKYHSRMLSLHIKDRKVNNGPNVPLGQGDTPLALALWMMQREKYQFTVDIEYEVRTPEDSDVLTEIAKQVEFCREVLT